MFKSLTPTFSIIIAIVLFVFFTSPQYARVQDIRTEIQQYQSTIADYQDFNAELTALLDRKSSIQIEDLERVDKMIPDTADNTRMLVDIKAMADSSGVVLGNVSADTETVSITNVSDDEDEVSPSENLVVSNISFDIIGSYEQFKTFLRTIESSLTLMEITRITLGAATAGFQQYSISIQTYSLSE